MANELTMAMADLDEMKVQDLVKAYEKKADEEVEKKTKEIMEI